MTSKQLLKFELDQKLRESETEYTALGGSVGQVVIDGKRHVSYAPGWEKRSRKFRLGADLSTVIRSIKNIRNHKISNPELWQDLIRLGRALERVDQRKVRRNSKSDDKFYASKSEDEVTSEYAEIRGRLPNATKNSIIEKKMTVRKRSTRYHYLKNAK